MFYLALQHVIDFCTFTRYNDVYCLCNLLKLHGRIIIEIKHLVIKKVYFEQILNGSKHIEYRAHCAKYESWRGFRGTVLFYYYTKRRLAVRVDRVRLIKTPRHLRGVLNFGDKVFAIHLCKTSKRKEFTLK
jgi:hypothetical protein